MGGYEGDVRNVPRRRGQKRVAGIMVSLTRVETKPEREEKGHCGGKNQSISSRVGGGVMGGLKGLPVNGPPREQSSAMGCGWRGNLLFGERGDWEAPEVVDCNFYCTQFSEGEQSVHDFWQVQWGA